MTPAVLDEFAKATKAYEAWVRKGEEGEEGEILDAYWNEYNFCARMLGQAIIQGTHRGDMLPLKSWTKENLIAHLTADPPLAVAVSDGVPPILTEWRKGEYKSDCMYRRWGPGAIKTYVHCHHNHSYYPEGGITATIRNPDNEHDMVPFEMPDDVTYEKAMALVDIELKSRGFLLL